MNREEFYYLLPYIISLALSLVVFMYTWRHRSVRGAITYSWFVGGQTLTIAGFILELVTPDLQTKIVWDKFQWLTISFLVIIPFLVFSIQYSEYKLHLPLLTWGYWIGMPTLFTLVLLTDDIHHLLYPNPHLSSDFPFPELQYQFTFVVYLYALFYAYGSSLYGIGLLTRRAIKTYRPYNLQYWTIIIGFSIPLILSLVTLANIRITPQRDFAPISLAIGNLVVAWGLFRHRLFDMVPIARERVFENMADQVIVLDMQDRIIDINQSALEVLDKNRSEVIGKSNTIVYSEWTDLIERFQNVNETSTEINATVKGKETYYSLNITPLHDKRREVIGRVVVAHDITKRKILEDGYRLLSEELEQRVQERTEEVRKIAERYRAVVENQTEFIVRWKPDGIRTFVNEAYCRYFGITPEQAVGTSFMLHVVEEDRKSVEEKISRLISGAVGVETEIHRVLKPDGGIGWQEWTDQAILDESGNLIEFQSVGRDITERRQAEEDLAEAYDTTLEGWAKALELRDKETEGHSCRVTEQTLAVARAMGIPEDELKHIHRGSILHDIGKMGIPDDILRKKGPLTEEERILVQKHPITAYNLLKPITYLEKALDIPYCHHEKWDGSGYPRGLKGEEIPLAARIFAVVDVWDALSSKRPYRDSWPHNEIKQNIIDESGKHFDPHVVTLFLNLLEKGGI